jgi:hypothetical protein
MKGDKKSKIAIEYQNYKIGCAKKIIDNCYEIAKILDDEKSKKSCDKLEKQCKEMKKNLKK